MSSVFVCHNKCQVDVRSFVTSNIILVRYDFDYYSLKNLLDKLLKSTAKTQIKNLGLYIQLKKEGTLTLSGIEPTTMTKANLTHRSSNLRRFIRTMVNERFLSQGTNLHIFLHQSLKNKKELSTALKEIVRQKIRVQFVDKFGSNEPTHKSTVSIYLNLNKMLRPSASAHDDSNSDLNPTKIPSHAAGHDRYERIRVVGKGSFGNAILYRRKDDDSLVILKEINMHELNPNERQLSLNEVSLLSRLDHPNIISYYDSFHENGVLMIEMEYAEGGTLAQLLARKEEYMDESEILYLFEQIISACTYLHDNNVLHRDLKTANIFLTKDNLIKIGDFGISKIMGTSTFKEGAQTILGTPYYLSPEMCEGKAYNAKSDIWSLGCCLYEMACLQKPFDASSLPALVNKIVHANYEPVKGPYSNELKLLIRDMLKTNPDQRPTAADIQKQVQKHRSVKNKATRKPLNDTPPPAICYSVLYQFDIENVSLSVVPTLPAKINIKQLVISQSHYLLLTEDGQVLSWGDNKYGQLGHGDRKSRVSPTRIEALQNRNVQRIAVGSTFSVFCADQGIVMICGNKRFVGIQHLVDDVLTPRLIDNILRENISDISCGNEHIVAVTEDGQVFVWGTNIDGRLGTGNLEEVAFPKKLDIPTKQLIANVQCGPDCTMLITSLGTIIVMGSNRFNKLNLNYRMGFFANVKNTKTDISNIIKPTPLKPFSSRVVDASLGPNHSGLLLENGHVHLFGKNSMGELGTGNRQTMQLWMAYKPVKTLVSKVCVQIICGNGFTMAATSDNELYFWGSKGSSTPLNSTTTERLQPSTRHDSLRYKSSKKTWQWRKGYDETGSEQLEESLTDLAITQPILVMRLDSTRTSSGKKPFIRFSRLVCANRSVMIAIDTSPILMSTKKTQSAGAVSTMYGRRSSAPELEGATQVPTWIRREMDDAEFIAYNQGSRSSMNTSLAAEQQIKQEIKVLKKQIQEQNNTFKGQQDQMKLLQQKLNELQQIQKHAASRPNEPPPAYPSDKLSSAKPLKNPFVPNVKTKICSIM